MRISYNVNFSKITCSNFEHVIFVNTCKIWDLIIIEKLD